MIRFSCQMGLARRRLLDVAGGVALGAAVAFAVGAHAGDGAAVSNQAAAVDESAPAGLKATSLAVIDGDTFEARVMAFPGQDIVARIRLDGVDAPERRGRCAAEKQAAEAATRALENLVEGRRLTLTQVRGDKYFGRVVARVSGAGVGDLAEALVAGGYGRPYAGGRREGWC